MAVMIAARVMLGIVAYCAVSSASAQSQEFSADLVIRHAEHAEHDFVPANGKLNVSGRKVRIETPDLATGYFIVRDDVGAAYFVRPVQRVFMDAKQSSQLTQVLVPVDPNDPCRQWQRMAQIAGAARDGAEWRCERIGFDRVDGRDTIRYRVVSPVNRQYLGWIDQRLGFLIRLEAEGETTVDVVNIHGTPQSKELFEIPPAYRKFDPQQLIDRIRQSDVWVEPIR
jgi:hypothetical protein